MNGQDRLAVRRRLARMNLNRCGRLNRRRWLHFNGRTRLHRCYRLRWKRMLLRNWLQRLDLNGLCRLRERRRLDLNGLLRLYGLRWSSGWRGRGLRNLADHADAAYDAIENARDNALACELVLIDVIRKDQRLQYWLGHSLLARSGLE